MEWFEFNKFSCAFAYVSDMKKSDFEKEFRKVFDVKAGWKHLQVLKSKSKRTSKK